MGALRWHRAILVLLIAAGLVSGLPDLAHRIAAERGDRNVELVADQKTFEELAASVGQTPDQVLGELKAVGVQGLGVPEDSLNGLQAHGLATVLSGTDLLDARRGAGLPPPPFPVDPTGTYALFDANRGALAQFVFDGLKAASGLPVQRIDMSDSIIVGVPLARQTAGDLPLGFRPATPGDPGAFGLARSLGMDVVPRPESTADGLSAAAVRQVFSQIAAAGVPVHTVLFAGASTQPAPGYPDNLAVTADILKGSGWNLGVIETPKQLSNVDQPGTRQINDAIGQRTVRVYSVPPWMLKQYSEPQTVTALATSVQERNLRMLYLHPYGDGPNLAARTVGLYQDTADILRQRGYQLGPPQPFPDVRVHTSQRVLQALAVVAAGLWLLELLFPAIRRFGYQPLAVLGALAVLLAAGSRSKSQVFIGMAAASTFGGLAMYYVADLWNRLRWPEEGAGLRDVWRKAAGAALVMAAISFAGGLIVATLLGDTTHFLEWEYFRGIKVTYLGIPVLALAAFAAAVGFGARREEADRGLVPQAGWLGEQPLRYKHVAVMLVVAAALGVYLLRSGNVSSSLVPGIETHLRDFLERHVVFRPREKEFLIGYPSVFLAMLCAARRWRWGFLLFLLGASTGQVSLVDTFEHIRTPFLTSLPRELLGLAGGILTGTVALLVAWCAIRLWERWRGAPAAGPQP